MSLTEYAVLAFSSLFAIMDPVAVVPLFLAITPNDTPEQRVRMAQAACLVATGVLLVFVLAGNLIFKVLGITMPAFQIAGSILLMMIAMDMLQARRPQVKETPADTEAGMSKDDIAVTPLAVPMLAGPGAISTALILWHRAEGATQQLTLCSVIVLVGLVSFWVLR